MGCSQGKTTQPSAAGQAKPSAQPTSTLLSPNSQQKQQTKSGDQSASAKGKVAQKVVDAAANEELVAPNGDLLEASGALDTHPSPQEVSKDDSKDWPLRWKALSIFALASQRSSGSLNFKTLAGESKPTMTYYMHFIEMLESVFEGDQTRSLSRSEWLQKVKQLVLQDESQASAFLDLCVVHLHERVESWPLRDEALQVFRMGDRNGDKQLDLEELAEIRQSEKYAQAMMDVIDIDKNGTVSQGEWLAYIKRLADQDEKSAAAVLALYREHLSTSKNTTESYDTAKHAMDVLVEEGSVTGTSSWWACC